MKTIQGPGIFLAQFASDEAPFNTLEGMAHWAAKLGFAGVQIPTWDRRLFNLELAATSESYCDEVQGVMSQAGISVTELSTHQQGQLVASHGAYHQLLAGFAPPEVASDAASRQEWAVQQLIWAAKASLNLGLTAHATFSGALAWPYFYPWPQRPAGLIEEAFQELASRWLPILHAYEEAGVDLCFELHPGEDLHDGITFERFLYAVNNHPRASILYDPSHMVLQQMDYLAFLDIYHERIRAFHVKDAEYRPTGRSGVYGGYQDWIDRPGRFRSLGDGQVDFRAIFSKLAQYDYPGWAVLEWECCLKHPKVGAAEGAAFIRDRIIRVTDHAFDDFASSGTDAGMNRNILGLNPSAKAAAPAVAVIPQVPAAESVDTAPPTKAQAASVAEKNAEAVGEWAQTSASPVPVVGIDAKAAAKAEWAAEPASSSPVKSTPQPVLNKPVVVEARRKREQEPSPQPERGKEHSVSKLELVEPAEAVSPAPTQTSRPHATVDPEAGKEIEPRTVTPEISAGKSPAKIERTAGPVVVESVMAASAAAVADQASTLDVKKPVREPDPPTVVVDTRTVATTKPESRPFERQTAPVEMQSAVPVEEVPESAVARTVAPIPETVDLARVTPEAQTEAPQVPAEKRSAKGRVQSRMEIAEPEPEPAAAGIADAKAAARAEWYAEPPAPTLVANEPEPEMSEPARIAYDWTREPQPADESAASEAESIQAPAWATHEEQSPVIEPEEEIAEPAQIEYKWQHEPEAEAQAEPAPEKKSRMNGAAPNGTKSDAPAAGSAWKAVKKWWKEHDPAPSPYGKEWGRPAGAPARVQSPAEEQPESGSGSPVALLEEADSWQFLKPVSVHKPRVESQPEFTLSRAQAVDEPRVVEEFNTEAVSTIQAVPEREAAPAEQRGMTEPPVVLETVEAPVASAPELRAETQNEPESASEQHDDSEWLPFS